MAVAQYIGARYVPIFYTNPDDNSNNWKSGVIYDPLTIVMDLNQSYTSKIPVPASVGRPSENPTYWILTGAYNAQVEQYRQEVTALSGDVQALDLRADALEGDITETQNEITALENSLQRKYLIITDSYADGGRGGQAHGWVNQFCSVLGAVYGTDVLLYQKGGAGFVGAGQNKTFGDLLNDAINELSEETRAAITDIIIAGGDNDVSYAYGTINTAKDTVLATIRSNFPNAVTWIACIGGFRSSLPDRYNLYTAVKYVYDFTYGRWVKPIYNAHLAMMFSDSFDSDNVHPNNTGVNRIGTLVGSALLTRSSYGVINSLAARNAFTAALASGLTGEFKFNVDMLQHGVHIHSIAQNNINGTSFAVTYNNGGNIKIGSITLTSAFCPAPNAIGAVTGPTIASIPAVIEGYVTTSEIDTIAGEIRFCYNQDGTHLDIYFVCQTAVGSKTYGFVRVKPFDVVLNYM